MSVLLVLLFGQNMLYSHLPVCGTHVLQAVRYPEPGRNTLKIKNTHCEFPVSFCIYADFESILVKSDNIVHEKSTKVLDTHLPNGFGAVTVSSMPIYNNQQLFIYRGPDVVNKFFKHLRSEQVRINKILATNKTMLPLQKEQLKKFCECTNSTSCNVALTSENKVKHHCHITGNFLSALCNLCNLLMRCRKRMKGKH